MINVNKKKATNNVVIELYKKFNLIASKIILLKVYKSTRDFGDWIDANLPQPTLIAECWDGYYIGWATKGKINTKKQKDFYKSLSLRLKKTLLQKTSLQRVENSSVWALQYVLDGGERFITKQKYEMKKLASFCLSLTSKEEKEKRLDNTTTKEELQIYASTYGKSEDALFDFIRFKVYDYKRANIINGIETKLTDLENYALAIAQLGYDVIGGKGISTATAKAKNIAKWTYYNYNGRKKRKRKTRNDKELAMTRRERALTNAQEKYNKAHKKVLILIAGIFAEEYKKKNGEWNVAKIARDAKVDRKTVYKHLKDWEQERKGEQND